MVARIGGSNGTPAGLGRRFAGSRLPAGNQRLPVFQRCGAGNDDAVDWPAGENLLQACGGVWRANAAIDFAIGHLCAATLQFFGQAVRGRLRRGKSRPCGSRHLASSGICSKASLPLPAEGLSTGRSSSSDASRAVAPPTAHIRVVGASLAPASAIIAAPCLAALALMKINVSNVGKRSSSCRNGDPMPKWMTGSMASSGRLTALPPAVSTAARSSSCCPVGRVIRNAATGEGVCGNACLLWLGDGSGRVFLQASASFSLRRAPMMRSAPSSHSSVATVLPRFFGSLMGALYCARRISLPSGVPTRARKMQFAAANLGMGGDR